MNLQPKYPVFIPTRGRVDNQLTAKMMDSFGVPFKLVVEEGEAEAHVENWGEDRVLVLPESGRGLVYSRNWIKRYSTERGDARHWQFDDDIRRMVRLHLGRRLTCPANVALAAAEDFVDQYENVAVASFNSWFFVPTGAGVTKYQWPPIFLNHRCYTDFLVLNSLPNFWRGRYNEDTDMTLQVLADGWCTVLFNAFLIDTPTTLTAGGGQMTSPSGDYQGDGRLKMSRELERRWPGVVTTGRRFHRPQHLVKHEWRRFDTQLKRKPDAEPLRSYDMKLVAKKPVASDDLKKLLEDQE